MSVRTARGSARTYSACHPDSPIALGFDHAGPVHVPADRADIAHAVGRKDLQRAYGLGICSASRGLEPDCHQVATGLWVGEIDHPADYLAMWITTGVKWAVADIRSERVDVDAEDAYNADRTARIDQWAAELVTFAPSWYVDWLARTVHPPKWGYLVELGAEQWLEAGTVADPGAEWVGKVQRQWARRIASGEHVDAVVAEIEQF